MHLDTDRVQRLLHAELPAADAAAVREHLASCHACHARVSQAEQDEREVMRLLGALDHVPPTISAERVLERARVVRRMVPRVVSGASFAARWAAGLLMAFGMTSVAYAIPGSPVRGWIDAIGLRVAGFVAAPTAPTAPVAPDPAPMRPDATAGIAVAPGRELVMAFTSPLGAQLSVALVDGGTEVVVLAPPGVATFTAGGDRLEIAIGDSSARLEIRIPRQAPRVEILVNGVRRYLKVGARIRTPADPATTGTHLITVKPDL